MISYKFIVRIQHEKLETNERVLSKGILINTENEELNQTLSLIRNMDIGDCVSTIEKLELLMKGKYKSVDWDDGEYLSVSSDKKNSFINDDLFNHPESIVSTKSILNLLGDWYLFQSFIKEKNERNIFLKKNIKKYFSTKDKSVFDLENQFYVNLEDESYGVPILVSLPINDFYLNEIENLYNAKID